MSGLPADVSRLLATHIDSVEQLEVLLLLRTAPERGWTAAEASGELRTEPDSVTARLRDLEARGFVTADGSGPARLYRYRPATPDLARAVDGLADAYASRKVTVIGLIFSKPSKAVLSFSDAFRLRRDE